MCPSRKCYRALLASDWTLHFGGVRSPGYAVMVVQDKRGCPALERQMVAHERERPERSWIRRHRDGCHHLPVGPPGGFVKQLPVAASKRAWPTPGPPSKNKSLFVAVLSRFRGPCRLTPLRNVGFKAPEVPLCHFTRP